MKDCRQEARWASTCMFTGRRLLKQDDSKTPEELRPGVPKTILIQTYVYPVFILMDKCLTTTSLSSSTSIYTHKHNLPPLTPYLCCPKLHRHRIVTHVSDINVRADMHIGDIEASTHIHIAIYTANKHKYLWK